VVQQYGQGQAIAPGQTIISSGVPVTAVPAYNTNKPNHPKSNNWVGFIIELGGKRTYVAGDTDLIPEMQTLGKIDVAFLPAGGTYTMNATEAAQAATIINPTLAIPYHWGTSVGTLADAQTFAELAACAVKILAVGETIGSDNWPEYSPLIAHWKLDEIEGNTAHDSADDHDGTLHGSPDWQPEGGNTGGSLQFDGVNDYISTDFVLNPVDGAFSVFAWIKGSVTGQVVISQTDGTGTGATWLGTEQSSGKLMTGLVPPQAGRFPTPPLISEFVITDNQWHHIGLVWDGSRRHLYVDSTEVTADTGNLAPLKSSDGGLHIGVGKDLDTGSFWLGQIDDVRIYNKALSIEDIDELVQ
ncbi:MAG: LamG-like jellyroll fold domain-containing protein, partial [Planctomycetota bacterium]